MSVIRDSGTEPFDTASERASAQRGVALGMVTSRPARAVATPACWAPQSETTNPYNTGELTAAREWYYKSIAYLEAKLCLEDSI